MIMANSFLAVENATKNKSYFFSFPFTLIFLVNDFVSLCCSVYMLNYQILLLKESDLFSNYMLS